MASDRDFLTTHGWAFVALREAGDRVEAAPDPVRLDLRIMLNDVEQSLYDDLAMVTNRAATMARRIGAMADSATPAPQTPSEGGTDG